MPSTVSGSSSSSWGAADAVIGRCCGGRLAVDPFGADAQLDQTPLHGLPAVGAFVEIDAGDAVEGVEGVAFFCLVVSQGLANGFFAQEGGEMVDGLVGALAEFVEADEVVEQANSSPTVHPLIRFGR
ncbi:hypothetical protein [Kitasatospora sp. GP82]|uniref:hypothetical protein n=1 Tax=Kitasatospora sp. GP82 TaxID=3035089 RepID=UPI002474FDDB|nr:hypothetical protein [Kitasatospora sp. GP82]MDH6129748.1 hypothetical protein [Kitasatospora sp. GP82]